MAKAQTKALIKGKALLPAGEHEGGLFVTGELWVPAEQGQYSKAIKFVPKSTPNQEA